MDKLMIKIVDIWQKPSSKHRLFFMTFVLILLILFSIIVYYTGGTTHAYVHLMYLPIIIAAFFGGITGGVTTALLAGFLMGPIMPLNVEQHIAQPLSSIALRLLFFILVSLVVGYISTLLKSYIKFANSTYDYLSSTYANTLRNYAKMISARDEQVAHHCERVAYNSRLVGIEYGLNEHDAEALYWAGLLHDIGKIGVKENVLLKPDKLTNDEYIQIKYHTILGYELINSLSEHLKSVSEGVRSHHEKWNGEGYPDGLKGEEIPIFGRIISIVDVFEALTSTRPYKDSWSKADSLQYIIDEKGKSFDPEIVDIFVKLYEKGKIWIYNEPIELDEQLIPLTFHINQEMGV